MMKILGIETSCDETAVAIVDDNKQLLSNLVYSQIEHHIPHGGVVPEIAARAHGEHLDGLIKQALQEANLTVSDLDAIAATCGPGLIGGVMIGMVAGKALAWSANKPFIPVNHLEGHALTPRLTNDVPFPYLLLLVSGGHTQILLVKGVGDYQKLGTTIDDAVGECFDKSAKSMGLGYPGGPALEALASECKNPEQALKIYDLPSPLTDKKTYDFSFSGLKTSVLRHIEKIDDQDFTRETLSNLAYALQHRIAEILADRCKRAIEAIDVSVSHLVVSGGVAANKTIRAALEQTANEGGLSFVAPPMSLCTDNAAMIAWAGLEHFRLAKKDTDFNNTLSFKARPRWPLDELKRGTL